MNIALLFPVKKASYTVDHETLVRKLKVYVIDDVKLECFDRISELFNIMNYKSQ